MSEPVINVTASYNGLRNGYHVRGYEQAFPTEGVTSQGVGYWKANLIEMKRIGCGSFGTTSVSG